MAENQSRTPLWQNCKATNSFTLVSGLGLRCHTQPLRLPHQEADSLARPKSKMERQFRRISSESSFLQSTLGVRCVYIDGAILTISAALGVVCPDLKISNVFEVKKTICSARGCETDNTNANWGMAMHLCGIHGNQGTTLETTWNRSFFWDDSTLTAGIKLYNIEYIYICISYIYI